MQPTTHWTLPHNVTIDLIKHQATYWIADTTRPVTQALVNDIFNRIRGYFNDLKSSELIRGKFTRDPQNFKQELRSIVQIADSIPKETAPLAKTSTREEINLLQDLEDSLGNLYGRVFSIFNKHREVSLPKEVDSCLGIYVHQINECLKGADANILKKWNEIIKMLQSNGKPTLEMISAINSLFDLLSARDLAPISGPA